MKKVYIPKGETVAHNELRTEILFVNGSLKVAGKLTAKSIEGHGTVEAAEIICDTCTVDTVIAQIATAQKIAAKKLMVRDCRASEIVVTDFIEALRVRAHKLSMTLSAIEVCDADEIITLSQINRGMLGMLFASWWRSLFLPGKTATKAEKTLEKKSENIAPPMAESPITEDFLDALIDRLEARGFVYDAPYVPEAAIPFEKESAA